MSYSTGIRLYSNFCSPCSPSTIPDGSGNLASHLQATRYASWFATKGNCAGSYQNAPYRMPSGIIEGITLNALIPHQRKEDLQVSLVRGFGGAHGPSGGFGAWHWPWVEKEVLVWSNGLNQNQAIFQSGGPISYVWVTGSTGVSFASNSIVNIPNNRNVLLNNLQEELFSGQIQPGSVMTASVFNNTLSGQIQSMRVSADIIHSDPSQLRVSVISPQNQIRRIWNATTGNNPTSDTPSLPINSGSFFYAGQRLNIPDKLTGGVRAAVVGVTARLTADVPRDYKVSGLRVSASINHQRPTDVRLTLISPDGRRSFLKKESLPQSTTPSAVQFWSVFMTGMPEFNRSQASGVWQLLAQDLPAYSSNTGALTSFSIHMVSTGQMPARGSVTPPSAVFPEIPGVSPITASPITSITLSGSSTDYVLNWTGLTMGWGTPYRIDVKPPVRIPDGSNNWPYAVPRIQTTGRHANWFAYDYFLTPSFPAGDRRQTGIITEPVTVNLNVTHENLKDLRIYLNNKTFYPTSSTFPKDINGMGQVTALVTGQPVTSPVNAGRSMAVAHYPGAMKWPYVPPQLICKSGDASCYSVDIRPPYPPTTFINRLYNPGRISGAIEVDLKVQFGGAPWPCNKAAENSGMDYIQDLIITVIDPTGKRVKMHDGQSLAYYSGLNTPTVKSRIDGASADGCWETIAFSGYKVTGFQGSRISGTWTLEIVNKRNKYYGAALMGGLDGFNALWNPSLFRPTFDIWPPYAIPSQYKTQDDPGIENYNMIRPWCWNTCGWGSNGLNPGENTGAKGFGADIGFRMTYSGDFGPDNSIKQPGTQEIQVTFPTQFSGAKHNSVWELRIEDLYAGNTGFLNSWSVRVGSQMVSTGTPVTSGIVTGLAIRDFPLNFNGYKATGIWTLLVEDLSPTISGYVRGFTGQMTVQTRTAIPVTGIVTGIVTGGPGGGIVTGNGGTLILSGLRVNGFNNENSYGFWGLRVRDMVQGGTGHIHSWSMSITGRDFRVIHSGHVSANDSRYTFVPDWSEKGGGGTCGIYRLYP